MKKSKPIMYNHLAGSLLHDPQMKEVKEEKIKDDTLLFCVCGSRDLKQDHSFLKKNNYPEKYLSNLKILEEIDTHYICNTCGKEFLL